MTTNAPAPQAPMKNKSPLRLLYDTGMSVEKLRIQLSNRISAITRGVDPNLEPVSDVYAKLMEHATLMEHTIDLGIKQEVERYRVYNDWLRYVRGVGPGLAGQMLALLLPPTPEKGPSSWFKAAGLTPETRPDGTNRLPRARKGEGKITYHPWLRRTLFNVTDAFVKQGRYYRVRYDTAKRRLFALHMWDADRVLTRWESTGTNARYNMILTEVTPEGDLTKEETLEKFWRPHLGTLKGSDGKPRKDDAGHVLRESLDVAALEPTMAKAVAIAGTSDETWPLFRVDRAARWNTMHLFLSHLWDAWSVADGIPQRYQQPYAVEKLGHSVVIERPMPDEDGVI